MSALRPQIAADGREGRSRDFYITAVQEYRARYGEATAACFAPASAKRNGRPDLVDRYRAGRADGSPWPSLNALKKAFGGSFVEVLRAAGIPANSTGPPGGRRKPGDAEPIFGIRERVRYVASDKTKQLQARLARVEARALRAEERLAVERERAQRFERKFREVSESNLRLRADGARERAVRPARADAKPVTKTITKTVRVRDEKALGRLKEQLADARGSLRAVEAKLVLAERERDRARREVEIIRSEASLAAQEAKDAVRARDRSSDRIEALSARVERLTSEVEDERERALGTSEAAAASELVRRAEERTALAEERAARAEREMAEQGAAVVGEMRRLTAAEIAALRDNGPAGEDLMKRAILRMVKAQANRGDLAAALTDVARAAVNWRDRVSR